MSSTSVSLESLQYLLQHMDANKRFLISQHCPSLREIEKSIPLKIESLTFTKGCIKVNDTSYNIGIVREYKNREAPKLVTLKNENGGVQHEVDRYGFKDSSDEFTVTPGDVELVREEHTPRRQIGEENMRVLENMIRRCETQIAERLEKRPSASRDPIALNEDKIEVYRAKIAAYESRRDNIPPNFEHFFQLTKSRTVDKKEQKTIERYAHNKKFSETMKHLATVLFGGRSCPIFVKKINFGRESVIRLPIGVKFRIEKLMIGGLVGKKFEFMAPIIDEASFPLKKLGVDYLYDADAKNPIVATAEELRIAAYLGNMVQILSLKNPRVHITMYPKEEALERLMKDWIELQRPIGTECIIDFHHKTYFKIEDMLKRHNGLFIDDENVILPMSNDTQLKISYGQFPEFAPFSKWAVRFLTEAIQH